MLTSQRLALLVAGLLVVVPAQMAQADVHVRYDRGHRSKAKADIDSLKGRLLDAQRLLVEFEVEIEDARRHEAFELVLEVTRHGRHAAYRPTTFVVPLDRPTDYDDDEMEFDSRVVLELPDGVFADPRSLRLHARVVPLGDDRVLDHEDTSIKGRYRSRHRSFGMSFGVGYHH
jgi:hypothetical protein